MKKIFLLGVFLFSFFILNNQTYANERLHVITVNSEGSDAIILESDGHFGMIDTGENFDYPDGSDTRYPLRNGIMKIKERITEDRMFHKLETLGVKNLDFIIITHTHSDHIGSAYDILKKIPTNKVYLKKYSDERITNKNRLWDNLYGYDRAIKAANETGAKLIQDITDDLANFNFGNMKISLLNYENEYENGELKKYYDDNFNSILAIVEVNGKRMFFGGDMQNDLGHEDKYAPMIGKVDLMKFNHHYDTKKSNSKNFMLTLKPNFVIKTSLDDIQDQNYIKFLKENNMKIVDAGRCDVDSLTFDIKTDGIYDITDSFVKYGVIKENDKLKFKDWQGKYINKKGYIKNNSNWYYVDDNGNLVTGVYKVDNETFIFDNNGKLICDNWIKLNEKWYWANTTGRISKNQWIAVDGVWYWTTDDGSIIQNKWLNLNNLWYYFDNNGSMTTSKWIGNYYTGSNGVMLVNTFTPDGYFVDNNGKWYKNWHKNAYGKWYTYEDDSYPKDKWELIDNYWYYFDNNGYVSVDWKNINGKWYYFNENGQMLVSTWIDGYFLTSDGTMKDNSSEEKEQIKDDKNTNNTKQIEEKDILNKNNLNKNNLNKNNKDNSEIKDKDKKTTIEKNNN